MLLSVSRSIWAHCSSGLGYAIAKRMMDEFLSLPTTPPTKHLVLLLCTRSALKGSETIASLRAHLVETARESAWARAESARQESQGGKYEWRQTTERVHFVWVSADLCKLRSVYDLATQLRTGTVAVGDQQVRIPRLDVVILNAGMGGWLGIDWLRIWWRLATNLIEETTYPTFRISGPAKLLGKQFRVEAHHDKPARVLPQHIEDEEEPPLGEVFCANAFGHYILCHELMPLLRLSTRDSGRGGKIIFIGSIDGLAKYFDIEDIQGLAAREEGDAYGSSKRLFDYMVMTSQSASTRRYTQSFYDHPAVADKNAAPPTLYLAHPGIFGSDILPTHVVLACMWTLLSYLIRILGSPWHVVTSYSAATAPTWVALTDDEVLEDMGGSSIKWGSSVDRRGEERVKMTEIEGWGWNGQTGAKAQLHGLSSGEKRLGRRRNAVDVTQKELVEFEETGIEVWRQMEELRNDWDRRLSQPVL